MPTGYTNEVLTGKITNLEQFAKSCMRAFGACIHMRDEVSNAEYKPRTPSDYHATKIEQAKQTLKDIELLSDDEIIAKHKATLEESKEYHLKSIEKAKEGRVALTAIRTDVLKWNPPTKDHVGLKDFMIEQIEKTIDFDCKTDYNERELKEVESELNSLDAKIIRVALLAKANKDFAYHTKEYKADLKRCADSNKWVSDLMNSLNNNPK